MSMNYVTFNQDYSHLAVATSRGFRIYSTDPFQKAYESNEGDIGIIEMLFSTSLVAQILSPRRLVITNTKRQSTICELTFPTRVLAVRMNRKRLVVVLEDQIYLYDITNMKLLYTIETSPNPHAIAALSPSSENCYLAYPLPQKAMPSAFAPPSHAPPVATHVAPTSGDVLIFDTTKLQAINVVEAHRAPLSCVALNVEGTLLATASDKGTIIRVFSLPQAQKLFQFRRGSMPSRICSMAFNSTSTLLCVSSTTETVHIFRLAPQDEKHKDSSPSPERDLGRSDRSVSPSSEDPADSISYGASGDGSITSRKPNGTFAGMIRRTSQTVGKSFAATVGGYLPSAVTEIWEPARDFAWIRIPRPPGGSYSGPLRTVVAMSSNLPQVMVVTSEGSFLVFNIDLEKGGEGTLLKQYSLLESNERLGTSILE